MPKADELDQISHIGDFYRTICANGDGTSVLDLNIFTGLFAPDRYGERRQN